MTYIRHRARMVRQSVYEDIKATLTANQWLGEHPIGLLNGVPVNLVDYFPEAEGNQGTVTPPNTFAIDVGRPGEVVLGELGGNLYEQQYAFALAFWATSDAAALALFQDLHDRYLGFTPVPMSISLYNYWDEPPTFVVDMDVDAFQFDRNTDATTPHGVHLYFGQLSITDYLEQG